MHQRRLLVAIAIERLGGEVNVAIARAVDHRLDGGAPEQGLQVAWRQVGHSFHVGWAGEAGGQLRGDVGQWLAGLHVGLARLQKELHIAVVRHADDLGIGRHLGLHRRNAEEQQVALVSHETQGGEAGGGVEQSAGHRFKAIAATARTGVLLLALFDVVFPLHHIEQAVDVGNFARQVGTDDVAQDVALLRIEVDELGTDFFATLGDDAYFAVQAQVDLVKAQADRGVVQAADGQRLVVAQANAAQRDVLQGGVQRRLAIRCQGDLGVDPGAYVLALVDRFMNDVGGSFGGNGRCT
ncbi:hypothetical protein D3C81_818510 [compost metagenome]